MQPMIAELFGVINILYYLNVVSIKHSAT